MHINTIWWFCLLHIIIYIFKWYKMRDILYRVAWQWVFVCWQQCLNIQNTVTNFCQPVNDQLGSSTQRINNGFIYTTTQYIQLNHYISVLLSAEKIISVIDVQLACRQHFDIPGKGLTIHCRTQFLSSQ